MHFPRPAKLVLERRSIVRFPPPTKFAPAPSPYLLPSDSLSPQGLFIFLPCVWLGFQGSGRSEGDKPKRTNRAQTQILSDFRSYLQILAVFLENKAFGKRRLSQKTADFQETQWGAMGHKVSCKSGALICHPVTSRPLLFPQKEGVLPPCNFATTHLTASILKFDPL